ncbi:DUF3857 domain-containing protein [Bacteroides pyogenes]|uniref:DUF3857 domain-containing protein n=1 Tax=Bacteroides pyogenes TaxID=310300 RepID=UPI0011E3E59D|nr:DUF3857 domain-containing protein [Bacteroides pyogenes]MBR8708144.1 hypothetical protein [Bacteroides pyogenes]MBR8717227.1 hypothetical protein [Bacteroides pyogenes]MBR8746533.1 hypothetical protein [Bacteroides pyogenes]MBR8756805.1 hypothetical protein [Bacteroides pyogenes]MBR8780013.1 hypothetical protein [Bacteroides pyogenes]
MKKTFVLFAFLCFFLTPVLSSQQPTDTFKPSLKYGKPSEEELTMTTYAPDTAAAAVILYSKSSARYEFMSNEFRITYNYEVKIKVLKSEGTSYANISIPYYLHTNSSLMKESVSQIDASAYNLENGKIVRTKMKRDLIFEERLNKGYMQVKFSVPSVKEGTVFEYKYQLYSDFYQDISPWEAQKDIPVAYTEYEITIPEYFEFNIEMRGKQHLHSKNGQESLHYYLKTPNGGQEMITCSGQNIRLTGENLPSLRSDSYIWCADDYRSGVRFELRGLRFPNTPYKPLTQSWEGIDKKLLENEDFGNPLKMRNPYRNEMKTLGIEELDSRQDKISRIYKYVRKKISWNKQYRLYSEDVKKAVKEGTGSNADINFVLMSMLRDADIPCYPVVMSHKGSGMLPITHPSIRKLNTFVVAIADTDDTFVFLDGSATGGFLNTLPPGLMVDRARLIAPDSGSQWVDLSQLGKNQILSIVNASVDADGSITGKRQSSYIGQYAAELRHRYREAKDSTEFVSNLETRENIKINEFNLKGIDEFSPKVTETFKFAKQATTNNDLIYIKPMIFLHTGKCPFIQTERQLPLEMRYNEQLTLIISLNIPEGYTVEELPAAVNIKTSDGQGTCKYQTNSQNNTVNIKYTFAYNKLFHLPEEYPDVKAFWEEVAKKNNEILVLKKI